MKKTLLLTAIILVTLLSCKTEKTNYKTPVYAWESHSKGDTDKDLLNYFKELKNKGVDGLMYSAGHDPQVYKRVGELAKKAGLKFHSWIPTMVQGENPKLSPELYAINGKGESAFDKPAYVSYYKFLCPNKKEVYDFLENLYTSVAAIEAVDGVHLDYIRFPDVILARGLWDKYGLVMDKEYPQFDYCYCDDCTNGFKEKYNIDIKSIEAPSTINEWKQYRYDLITNIVNKLSDTIRKKGKKITAAVFPGPNSVAKKIVRQEWDKWNLDAYYPMNYNDFYLEGTDWVGKVTREAVTAVNNNKPVYSGLFIRPKLTPKSNKADPENHGLLPSELEEAIKESMVNGANGICLFTPKRMTDEHWKVFQKIIHTDYSKED